MEEHRRLETVARFLRSQHTLTLATSDVEGTPYAAPLFYIPADGLRLYWLSAASSAHSSHVERDPRVAISIYREAADWQTIRGVQMRGVVWKVLDLESRESILKTYRRRFRIDSFLNPVIGRSTLYCFQPEWARYIDNARGFGYRFELTLSLEDENRL